MFHREKYTTSLSLNHEIQTNSHEQAEFLWDDIHSNAILMHRDRSRPHPHIDAICASTLVDAVKLK